MGIHLKMAGIYSSDAEPVTSHQKELFNRRAEILDWETAYNHEQKTRPQMLGGAIGLAGWILEKFGKWSDLPKTQDGSPDI